MILTLKSTDFSISHVFKCLPIERLSTLHHICELQRTQLLPILAVSVQKSELADYF